jgi:two-component system chemotaxis response regulator CheY
MTAESCPASVLVVEDDEDIREAISYILENEGYEVVLAENGQQALELLPDVARPCLLLVDLIMPKMDGWDLLRALSHNDRFATIPVVVMSAVPNPANLAEQTIVKKPIDLAILLEIVQEHCCGQGGPGARSKDGDPAEPSGA